MAAMQMSAYALGNSRTLRGSLGTSSTWSCSQPRNSPPSSPVGRDACKGPLLAHEVAVTMALAAGAAVGLGRSRALRARTSLAAERTSWFSRRKNVLAQELKAELKEERKVKKDLEETIHSESEAAEKALMELTVQLAELRDQEAKLRESLKEAEEEERASEEKLGQVKEQIKAEGRTNWKAVVQQQTQMLAKILEVAERLERKEAKLRADLSKRQDNQKVLRMTLAMAEELSKGSA